MPESISAAPSPRTAPPRRAATRQWLACAAVCTLFGPIALGQPVTPPSGRPADPADAGAAVPALAYRSPVQTAARAKPVEAGAWRDANETAARIGGWRAYLREAQAPEPAPSPTPSSMPPPMHKH